MPSIGLNLRVTTDSKQGGRVYMEDVLRVGFEKGLDGKEVEFGYFAVFDGHGGVEAAQFAREHLLSEIRKTKGFWSDDDEQVLKAIKLAFINTHKLMWNAHMSWSRTSSGYPSTSGTTSSVVVIRNQTLYISHVGDSSVVLGSRGEGGRLRADCLTDEHKPNSPKEMSRIRESGGSVMAKAGVNRVVWQRPKKPLHGPIRRSTLVEKIPFLAVARSLGDLWSYNSQKDVFVVSPDPDTLCLKLDPTIHKCLLIASDGLWNVIKPQSAIDVIDEMENRVDDFEMTKEKPASLLVKLALRRWDSLFYRADNTSVICVMIDPPGPSTMRISRPPSIASSVATVKLGTSESDAEDTSGSDLDVPGSDCDIDLDEGEADDLSLSYEVGKIFPRLCAGDNSRERKQTMAGKSYIGSRTLGEHCLRRPASSPVGLPTHCATRTPCLQQARPHKVCSSPTPSTMLQQQSTQTTPKPLAPGSNILMEAALNAPPFLEPATHVTSPTLHHSPQKGTLLTSAELVGTGDALTSPIRTLRPRSPRAVGENQPGHALPTPPSRASGRFSMSPSSSFISPGSPLEATSARSPLKVDPASRSGSLPGSAASPLWPGALQPPGPDGEDHELATRGAVPDRHTCAVTSRSCESAMLLSGGESGAGLENVEVPRRGRPASQPSLGQGLKRRASSSPASLTARRVQSLPAARRSRLPYSTPNTRAHFKSPKKAKA